MKMEENEIAAMPAEAPAEPLEENEKTDGENQASAEMAEEEAEEKGEIPLENGISEEISAERFAKTLANPMFAVFAKGRSGSIEDAVRDFENMLTAGRSSLSEEELMKMTPGAVSALGGIALSERQREIARMAGMSYREYYEIIRTIPTKNKQK
jgi:hypothetical protein